jgi:hypothetical protein
MTLKNIAMLAAVCLCAGAPGLRAQDVSDADRNQQLQAVFQQFPLLAQATSGSGQPDYQNFEFKNPVMIGGDNYYGFRFTVPPRGSADDFILSFVWPCMIEWNILPQKGELPDVNGFIEVRKSDYMGTNTLVPPGQRNMMLMSYPGENLRDGETYLVWLHPLRKPRPMSLAWNFAPLGAKGMNQKKPMEKALGLMATESEPVVNPANHHTYLLLRQANWTNSEARAVKLGGHLATVRNQAEEDWLVKTFGNYGGQQRLLWIGLSDRAAKFHFTWSSGESVSYTAWAPREPNNAGHGEDYVAIYYARHKSGGKWNDWGSTNHDPIGLPMNGVVEIITPETPATIAANSPGAGALTAGGDATGGTGATNAKLSGGDPLETLQAVPISPTLIITNITGRVTLEWPVSAANYMLEAATNLHEPFAMFGYSELTNTSAGMVYVTISNPVPQMFFRLRKPDAPSSP